jgi:hypothetical protein
MSIKEQNKKREFMSWTLIFIFISGIAALIAGILQYQDRLKSSEKTRALQEELLNYTRGSKIFPVVTVLIPVNTREVRIMIHNPDPAVPMLNVSGLINNDSFNYGAIYPLAGMQIVHVPFNQIDRTANHWVMQLYYSNTEFVMISVQVYEINNKFVHAIYYSDRSMKDKTPDTQKKANEDVEKKLKEIEEQASQTIKDENIQSK